MNKKLKLLTGVWLMLLSVSPAFAQLHYSVNKNLAVIRVPGADSTLRILHISDSHITFPDERDKKYEVYSKRMASAYLNEVDAQTGKSVMGAEAFAKLMDKAVAQKVDLIALTGDIVNYPSEHAVDFVMKQLERTHTPFVYVSGNHDWHLEGMPGSDFEQREIWAQPINPVGRVYGCTPPTIAKRYMKNGISLTPFTCARKHLIFELRDSAEAFVCQSIK